MQKFFVRHISLEIALLLSMMIIMIFNNVLIAEADLNLLNNELFTSNETTTSPALADVNDDNPAQNDDAIIIDPPAAVADETKEATIVQFNDDGLIEAICASLGKPVGDISSEELLTLTSLDASNHSIQDLTGLEYATNLLSLDLSKNQLSNLSPLSNLTRLESLCLSYNHITDISVLSNLENLILLDLSNNLISSISAVRNFTKLKNLNLGDNQINYISSLRRLRNIEDLSLHNNQITDITILRSAQFQKLDLNGNKIANISPLFFNSYIDAGDWIDLRFNPLDEQSLADIEELRSREVDIIFNYVSIPVANPGGGDVRIGTQITLTASTPNSMIFYTTNGTPPTSASDLYTNPITINEPVTIKAFATADELLDSAVITAEYTIVKVYTPQSNLQPSKVPVGTPVKLSCLTPDASIYYTIDGTIPTTSSNIYTEPIIIQTDTTINAIAVDPMMAQSEMYTGIFQVSEALNIPFYITNAMLDPDQPVLYATDKENKKLYRLNYNTRDIKTISFDDMPESLEIGKGQYSNEIYVALLNRDHSYSWQKEDQSGKIAVIDRQEFSLQDTMEIQVDPYDIVAGRDGCLYIPSGSGNMTYFDSYDRSSKQRIGRTGISDMSPAQLHPSLDRIYTLYSSTGYKAYNISQGTFTDPSSQGGYDSPNNGDYSLKKCFEIDPAGEYIYNGSGTIIRTAPAKEDDMKYVGKLDQTYADIAFESDASAFYILPCNKSSIDVYDTATNLQIDTIPLEGKGEYIFKQDTELVVITQNPLQTLSNQCLQVLHLDQSPRVAAPVANPSPCSFTGSLDITLNTSTADAAIHYTTDGSIPTTTSERYTGPITIRSTTTFKAIAAKADMRNSAVMTAVYSQEQVAMPTAESTSVESCTQVTLSTTTPDAIIYYTIDRSMPTTNSTIYTEPIIIKSAMRIMAIAVKSGMEDSAIMSKYYHMERVEAPKAEPKVGSVELGNAGAVEVGTAITLTTSTPDASIYYTIDKSTPTTESILYKEPIIFNSPMCITAIAVKPGMQDSPIMCAFYKVAQIINIPDPNLLAVVRSALNKPTGNITDADMLMLTDLRANSKNIRNLSGLEYATNLEQLYLYNNQINDISALSGFNYLGILYLNNNQISDISSLGDLTSLNVLYLNNNGISDISSLRNLDYLKFLYLHDNQIIDINALDSVTTLQGLELKNNRISHISALRNLTSLKSLSLDNNQIYDISPLVQNSGIGTNDYLGLKGNPLNNIRAAADVQTLMDRGASVYWDETQIDECFIATAAFGSKLEPQVVLLRQFRDRYLLSNPIGKAFVNFYYSNSPPVARCIKDNELLKWSVRVLLIPVIAVAYSIMHPVVGLGCILVLLLILLMKKSKRKVVRI